jgi:hypothetical protein
MYVYLHISMQQFMHKRTQKRREERREEEKDRAVHDCALGRGRRHLVSSLTPENEDMAAANTD